MDLLDDVFSELSTVKAPVRAKFQPKAKPKPKPRKGSSSAAQSHVDLATKEQAILSALANSDSSQLFQPNDPVDKNLDLPNNSSIEAAMIEESLLGKENVLTDGNIAVNVGDVDSGHLEITISISSGDKRLDAGTLSGSHGANNVTSTKADVQSQDASTTQPMEAASGFPDLAFTNASPLRPCNSDHVSIPSANQEPEYSNDNLVGCTGDFQIDMEQETVDFSFLEVAEMTNDTAAPSGKRAVKFQPKPKAPSTRKTNAGVAVSHLADTAMIPSENQLINEDGLIYAHETVTVSDDIDSMVTLNVSKEGGNENRKMSDDPDPLAYSHDALDRGAVSLGVEATEDGFGYLGGVNDELQLNSSSPAKDYDLEEETLRDRQNSEIVSSRNEKPSRKRKNEVKEPDESTKKSRKKFPHATRRKRSVDKSLLEAAEDEIDLHKVPIRDLIILSEYKQRQLSKQAAAMQPPVTSERSENAVEEDTAYNEDATYGSDHDTDSFDDPSTSKIINDTGYFNYRSYMDRGKKRWSKQETELFYQGLQEFGSDFTMIQQRYFADRSRHQVKLKYKKEEREHPMRIHDALTSRAKDLSHFEVLIQKLQEQEQAAQEKAEQSADDNLVGSTGEEDESQDGEAQETHNTSQETAKHKQKAATAAAPNQEPVKTTRVESAAKSNDSEDEFGWNDYRSEL